LISRHRVQGVRCSRFIEHLISRRFSPLNVYFSLHSFARYELHFIHQCWIAVLYSSCFHSNIFSRSDPYSYSYQSEYFRSYSLGPQQEGEAELPFHPKFSARDGLTEVTKVAVIRRFLMIDDRWLIKIANQESWERLNPSSFPGIRMRVNDQTERQLTIVVIWPTSESKPKFNRDSKKINAILILETVLVAGISLLAQAVVNPTINFRFRRRHFRLESRSACEQISLPKSFGCGLRKWGEFQIFAFSPNGHPHLQLLLEAKSTNSLNSFDWATIEGKSRHIWLYQTHWRWG
jgi:hypothetical protein